jgi:hypothetical protein
MMSFFFCRLSSSFFLFFLLLFLFFFIQKIKCRRLLFFFISKRTIGDENFKTNCGHIMNDLNSKTCTAEEYKNLRVSLLFKRFHAVTLYNGFGKHAETS